MSKKTDKKEAKKPAPKARVPGARFEHTKKLLVACGVKVKPQTSKLVCNVLDCKVKLPIQGELNGKPISRHRWCNKHKALIIKVRSMHGAMKRYGYSPNKLSPKRYNVRAGKLTVWARLHGADPEKTLEAYKQGRRGRRFFGLATPGQKQKKAAKKASKKLAVAAKKVVKAVVRPAAKKVPAPKAGLRAMLNGKGADVQAAVAAHAARKAAESKA